MDNRRFDQDKPQQQEYPTHAAPKPQKAQPRFPPTDNNNAAFPSLPLKEINRSSSAPPTHLFEGNSHQNDSQSPYSATQAWGLWAPPGNSPVGNGGRPPSLAGGAFNNKNDAYRPAGDFEQQQQQLQQQQDPFYQPLPVQKGWNTGMGGSAAPSPRRRIIDLSSEEVRASSPLRQPPLHGIDASDIEDRQRVNSLLSGVLDADLSAPMARPASTPPVRMQPYSSVASHDHNVTNDLLYGMQNVNIGGGEDYDNARKYESAFSNDYDSGNARGYQQAFSPYAHHPTQREMEMMKAMDLQQRAAMGGLFETESAFSINRPASALGRFVNTPQALPSRYGSTPPGLSGNQDMSVDPATLQALQTLSANGNFTPQQILQIQMQLAQGNAQQRPQSQNQWEKKPSINASRQPPRPFTASPSTSPQARTPSHSMGGRIMDGNEGLVPGEAPRSQLLEEFRTNKSRKFEVRDIVGSIVEFSGDQHGSRFIQQKLEICSDDDKQLVFNEIVSDALPLMTDVFGNYVIQKFFEHGTPAQKLILSNIMEGSILNLSLQMYGCRVVQKAFEHITPDRQHVLIKELEGNVLKCVKDQNGNHVIQKAVERVAPEHIKFIIDSFYGQVYALATHPYGCRVIQRIFEHCTEEETKPLLEELHRYAISLIQDQYGNYVIQHILERGKPQDKQFIISKVKGNVLAMSKHKFASNVVEKCVTFGSAEDRHQIIDEVALTKSDGTTALFTMMKDQFANYVVQKLLDVASETQRVMLVTKIKPQLSSLKKFTYGKHLISKVEKYIVQYGIE